MARARPQHARLLQWVEDMVHLCEPDDVRWCQGTAEESAELCHHLVQAGTFVQLNSKLRPNSYLARSTPDDVARVEDRTFICTTSKDDAGPTNNWAAPQEMKDKLNKLFKSCMHGRTMYVIPFAMGPLESPLCRVGVQITDSAYVVVNMAIMARVGPAVLQKLGRDGFFLPCLHSVGAPLAAGQKDTHWPCNPEHKYICHFPEDPLVMSYGSGYGGNALLGKKCFALRIASNMARREGWMAEHCLLMSLTSPDHHKYYIAAAFPSQCGKTNLAMLVPTIPGWMVRCLGDDITWMYVDAEGHLRGVNPETGYFGVAPGTSELSNKSALTTLRANSIFTNVALTPEGDVWWEDKTAEAPPKLEDWTYQEWTPGCGRKAAHPNARYTTPAKQNPVLDPDWERPEGVPISAIVFGGRRSQLVPLVAEAFSWEHGVFLGSVCSSETTAAAAGQVGVVRRDPFAMLPFCGYHMGDYFRNWLDVGKRLGSRAPKIFYVNWFRKDSAGQWLWPGFGENSRVLKWISERVDGRGKARSTCVGFVPTSDALDLIGLHIQPAQLEQLLQVDDHQWKAEATDIHRFYQSFGVRLPAELVQQLAKLEERVDRH